MKLIPAQLSFVFLSLTVIASAKKKGCEYPTHLSQTNKSGEHQIAPLIGERYEINDGSYTYYIGICAEAMDPYPDTSQRLTGSGVVQMNQDEKLRIIGKFDHADIMAGPEWVMLEYNAGDKYGSHCIGDNNEPENRRARILFICDPNQVEPVIQILDKQNNKRSSCYYLFEISTTHVCPKQPFITVGLSVGSVLLIVFFCVGAVCLIGGCMYIRFVHGSKGPDQIPNRAFWQDFGNLQTDGCDLICRTGKHRQPRTYKGIGDDQLQDTDDQTIYFLCKPV